MGKDTRKPPKSQVQDDDDSPQLEDYIYWLADYVDSAKQYLKVEIASLRGEVQYYREEAQRQHNLLVNTIETLQNIHLQTRWSIAKNNNLIRKFLRLVADMGEPPARLEPATPPKPAPPPSRSAERPAAPKRGKRLPPRKAGDK